MKMIIIITNKSKITVLLGIVIIYLVNTGVCYSQRNQIDSLRKEVANLKDSSRNNCLNLLSLTYSYFDPDTAKLFARKAFDEAAEKKYRKGMAASMNTMAHILGYGYRDFESQEKISRQQIKNNSDSQVIIDSYFNLALALYCQGRFDNAREICFKIKEVSKRTKNEKAFGEALAIIGSLNFEIGNFEESFDNFNQSLTIFKRIRDSYNCAIIFAKLGDIYRLAGDRSMALNFYFQSLEFKRENSLEWHPLVDLGDTYYPLEPEDETTLDKDTYLQAIKLLTIQAKNSSFSKLRKAENLVKGNDYTQALFLLEKDLAVAEKRKDINYAMRLLNEIIKICVRRTDNVNVYNYSRKLLQLARFCNAKQYLRDANHFMYSLFDQYHKTDSAYFYFRSFTAIKDSIALDEITRKLALFKAATENEKANIMIDNLNKEKQIREQQLEVRSKQLQNESLKKNILLIGLLGLALFGFLLVRYILLKQRSVVNRNKFIAKELDLQKLESEKMKQELQQRALELEMQALRSQMNPHFIFNSLNSINRFILQNNKLQASEYLTKFSRLVRMILQNSQMAFISLDSELEALTLYLELEAVRFEHRFDYEIILNSELDPSSIKIPPLLIQPYAENAIWHGLMHKEERGKVSVEISLEETLLCCRIIDNGIGRKRSAELKSKSAFPIKSMGMRITADRISILNQESGIDINLSVHDLELLNGESNGTEVCLKIPLQYA